MENSSSTDTTWTVKNLLAWAGEDFDKRGIETARLDAELLLANALSLNRMDLYLRFEMVPTAEQLARFRESVKRRRDREPVAHILGVKEFHEIEIMVPPGAFVPRPETEILVDEAITRLRLLQMSGPRLLDVCTGTGAIALAVLHALAGLDALATDLNPEAESTVIKNAKALEISDRITFKAGDLFEPTAELPPFDLITCNPPYIPQKEIRELMPEVREHEPLIALDGGPDGLDFIRRLALEAPERLAPGGWLVIEIGHDQEQKVRDLFHEPLVHEATRLDLSGYPRIVIFKKVGSGQEA